MGSMDNGLESLYAQLKRARLGKVFDYDETIKFLMRLGG